MRSQERKRGAKEPTRFLNVLSPEMEKRGKRPMVSTDQQAAARRARKGEYDEPTRGLRQDRASELLTEVTRETQLRTQGSVKRGTSVKSEDHGSSSWESEAPIRAVKPGNSGRAKGRRRDICRRALRA